MMMDHTHEAPLSTAEVPVEEPHKLPEGMTQDEAVQAIAEAMSDDDIASHLGYDDEDDDGEGAVAQLAKDRATSDEDAPADEAEEAAEDANDEGEDDEEAEEVPKYKVKVDGEEFEVDLPELIAGYQRQATFTRKTQELANQRREVEAERVRYQEAATAYAQRLEMAHRFLNQVLPPETVRAIEEEYANVLAVAAEDAQRQRQAFVAEQARLLVEAIPEWKDEAKAKAEKSELAEYLAGYGFTESDLANVIDHRPMILARKAMLYDRMMKAKDELKTKRVRGEAPRTLKPGTRKPAVGPKRRAAIAARKQLRVTGRVEDAAQLLASVIDD